MSDRLRKKVRMRKRKELYTREGPICAGCRRRFKRCELTLDHIVPISKEGCGCVDNLQFMCGPCNGSKAALSQPASRARQGHKARDCVNRNELKALGFDEGLT